MSIWESFFFFKPAEKLKVSSAVLNKATNRINALQEILALTGGGQVREYTETRPDGSTVTYTIDVEEEIIEVQQRTHKNQ